MLYEEETRSGRAFTIIQRHRLTSALTPTSQSHDLHTNDCLLSIISVPRHGLF